MKAGLPFRFWVLRLGQKVGTTADVSTFETTESVVDMNSQAMQLFQQHRHLSMPGLSREFKLRFLLRLNSREVACHVGVFERVVLPGASHLLLAAAAHVRLAEGTGQSFAAVELSDAIFQVPFLISDEGTMRVRCAASSENTEVASVQVDDGTATEATVHARFGTTHLIPFLERQSGRLSEWQKLCEADKQAEQDVGQLYSSFSERGLSYGTSFQTLSSTACFSDLGALAKLQDPCKAESAAVWEKSLQLLHPAQLDGALQLLVELAARQGEKATYLPFAVRRTMIAAQCPAGDLWAGVRVQEHHFCASMLGAGMGWE